jgi:hypothetical protein
VAVVSYQAHATVALRSFEEEKEIAKNQIFKIEHMAGVIGDRAPLQS